MMHSLLDALRSGRVLLMDGAMGTELIRLGCPPADCAAWNLTHPQQVRAVHRAYLDAGAKVLLTNTFYRADDVREAALERARSAGAAYVLADVGPSEYRDARHCLDHVGDVDGILLETMDTVDGLAEFARANGSRRPLLASFSFHREPGTGRLLAGAEEPERVAEIAARLGVVALGVNCGVEIGMDDLAEIVRRYRSATDLPNFVRPNAGTPVNGVYPRSPAMMADQLGPLLEAGVAMVGGCCGTTPAHVAAFKRVIDRWNAGR